MRWDVWQTDRTGARTRCLERGLERQQAEGLVDRDYMGVKAAGGHYQLLRTRPSDEPAIRKPKLALVGSQPHAPAGRARWERRSAWEPKVVDNRGRSAIYQGHAQGGPVKRFTRAEIAALRGDPGKASS
jgi:hypothetical protein